MYGKGREACSADGPAMDPAIGPSVCRPVCRKRTAGSKGQGSLMAVSFLWLEEGYAWEGGLEFCGLNIGARHRL